MSPSTSWRTPSSYASPPSIVTPVLAVTPTSSVTNSLIVLNSLLSFTRHIHLPWSGLETSISRSQACFSPMMVVLLLLVHTLVGCSYCIAQDCSKLGLFHRQKNHGLSVLQDI